MKKKIIAIILTMTMIGRCLAGCGKDKADGSAGTISGGPEGDYVDSNILPHPTEAPEDYTDNAEDLYEITDEERYFADADGNRILRRDEQVFLDGAGFQFYFAANMLYAGDGGQDLGQGAIRISDYEDEIDRIAIGGKEYAYGDLIADGRSGGKILETLAGDFGIDVYDADGNRTRTAERSGGIDELREFYSESADYEEYSARTYYFHADMNAFDDDPEREAAYSGTGLTDKERDAVLYGTFALICYYDPDGYDYFYSIVIDAPAYFNDDRNFDANKTLNLRRDISKCRAVFKDWPVEAGFLNNTCITVMGGGAE